MPPREKKPPHPVVRRTTMDDEDDIFSMGSQSDMFEPCGPPSPHMSPRPVARGSTNGSPPGTDEPVTHDEAHSSLVPPSMPNGNPTASSDTDLMTRPAVRHLKRSNARSIVQAAEQRNQKLHKTWDSSSTKALRAAGGSSTTPPAPPRRPGLYQKGPRGAHRGRGGSTDRSMRL